MATQRTLPLILSPEQPLDDLWERVPASCRREVIVIYAQLIARAARVVAPDERKESHP
jgi:hypothetical protein